MYIKYIQENVFCSITDIKLQMFAFILYVFSSFAKLNHFLNTKFCI